MSFSQEYPTGSKVWLKNMTNSHRMGGKMDKVHLGPYTVTEIADKGLYRLQNDKGKNLKKLYNGVLLKEYFPPVKAPEEEPSKMRKSKKMKVYYLLSKHQKSLPKMRKGKKMKVYYLLSKHQKSLPVTR